ncbi:MAG: carbohydrate ABC transporter permease [Anaerolineae bacterium]|nr:carbohydrate ABC transporter permease [Anaerolineae bacterium]
MATDARTKADNRGFFTRTKGINRLDWADIITYLYLFLGTFLMFGPVIWIVLSSFKTEAELIRFPPRALPYRQETVVIEGYEEPLPLFEVPMEDGSTAQLARVRRVGLEAQMVDPANPDEIIKADNTQIVPVEAVVFDFTNYEEGIQSFNFARYFRNSVVVTVAATFLTLFINSMAAFSLSKYEYRGRNTVFIIIISALMVPISVILVPAFLLITEIGWNNNLLGVIVPGAATPTGVFLLRQYMLTIPDDLIDAARIDGATEWGIYVRIILPLAGPALAVLAIFSVMWRWNDFLWPKIVLTRSENFTLQLGLQAFQGDLQVQWHLILAMTVLTILPITLVFAFLQRFITTGIATTGMK